MAQDRILFHVDLDCFYAAVEMRDRPELRHVPVVVGADPLQGRGRGVVCTANYPARRLGIHSAMPISQAYRACPTAVFLRPDWSRISPASDAVMDVLARYADVLEIVGIDEAYLDVTNSCTPTGQNRQAPGDGPDWAMARSLARSLQAAVTRHTGLSISIGVAPNKAAAKMASSHRKPHGITVVDPPGLKAFMAKLGVAKIPGCGPKTTSALADAGILTIAHLAAARPADVEAVVGSHAPWLQAVAQGRDERPVVADHGLAKSRSNERTFLRDTNDADVVRATAHRLLEGLLDDLQSDGRAFLTITVKVRSGAYVTVTRSHSFPVASTGDDRPLLASALDRLLQPLNRGPVRLVGVRLGNLCDADGQRRLVHYGLPWLATGPTLRGPSTVEAAGLRFTRLPVGAFDPGP